MTENRQYTPEEIERLEAQKKVYFAQLEANAKRVILTLKTIHPEATCTVIVRVEGGHAVVVSEDDPGEVVAAVYKTYAQSKN